ncbi:hypothetical protein I3843_14G060800 [Carya illinoinensis]|uniref:Smr domain-containing protein n=1 Tax=Carya illinoinensis TaxID=32201 RepID=A0A8T1NBK3_CARIL|nr:SMR domain-containing protein At5g58720-like isoform X1 [Carya illinoinensis]KAG2669964.1 hypothetical protein I3760_14G061600 [Carya illinoinensis]KAG2669965.1 hypothetical protein I3760_14G061600 [Carya illinoinensis]KAG6629087.1 hypothetical protein CIPAW_14G059500 [Carya illinoinensis]KAG6629089.1 hypothetical protein CIPAW_14G059500 [Carya illinoinensis]KAG7946791.1 hypothetical protein I3843_14G060800 [Carya illinoinensis]
MKNTKQKKRRRRPRASNPAEKGVVVNEDVGGKVPESLVEAFSLASLDDAVSTFREVIGDRDKAAEILGASSADRAEDPSTCSTSGASLSGSSVGFFEMGCVQNVVKGKDFRGTKQKRVVAATGTVSTVLGKDYVNPRTPRRNVLDASTRFKGRLSNACIEIEETEQFLRSMLGDECELSMDVVRDVLCQCGYDIEKAFDALLELSASTSEQSRNGRYPNDSVNYKEDIRFLIERKDGFTDKASDCTSYSSESEFQDNIWSMGYGCRNYSKVLTNPEADSPTRTRSTEPDLPQKVLESLFNISKSVEHEPKKMNWRNLVKKMQSVGPGFDVCPSSVAEPQQYTGAKGEEYHVFRQPSTQQWASVRSCYQKASVAFSKGEKQYAACLSEQGKAHKKLAWEADEKASRNIFKARNKGIENVVTIDLHGQHVKQAMQYVKAHLLFGTYVPSFQTLRVITGCGSHGIGKSIVKQSVIKLMQKEGIEWREENKGTLLIKLGGSREFSFMDSESDTE